ncbi:hypothetical protein G6F59_018408 [Rhizopus arrhizus]|nr:hypothetical protein G6F59_018408 [Rhizopus arrhizus]
MHRQHDAGADRQHPVVPGRKARAGAGIVGRTPLGEPAAVDHRRYGDRGARYASPHFRQRLLRRPERRGCAPGAGFPGRTHTEIPGVFRTRARRADGLAGRRQALDLRRPVVVPSG